MFRRAYSSFIVHDGISNKMEKNGLNNFRISFPAKYGKVPARDTGSIGANRDGTGGSYFIPLLLFRMNKGEEVAQVSFSIRYTLEEISKVAKIVVSPKGSFVKDASVDTEEEIIRDLVSRLQPELDKMSEKEREKQILQLKEYFSSKFSVEMVSKIMSRLKY